MIRALDRRDFDRAWQELHDATVESGRDYLVYHKERQWELFSTLAARLSNNEALHVLEVGISPFVRLYQKLLPSVHLTTIDRPVDMSGVSAATATGEWGAARHYSLDLNATKITPNFGTPPLGCYDFVVFCETLEHIPIDAGEIISELFSVLKPDGFLYLTTPNFFSYERLTKIINRDHPQENFFARGGDKWAATHVREYSMSELFRFVTATAGKVVSASYSDCWMDEATRSIVAATPALKSNLVVLAAHAASPHQPDDTVGSVAATFGPFTREEWTVLGLVLANQSIQSDF